MFMIFTQLFFLQGTSLLKVHAVDGDTGINDVIEYSLINGIIL